MGVIRVVPNVGLAVVPGVVCVSEFSHLYNYIASNTNLKHITQKSSAVMPPHSEPDQVCTGGIACSCKNRFRNMSNKNPDDEYGWNYAGYRNGGRKPRYKNHIGRVGKAGEMRAKYKRPAEINLTA